MSFAETALKFWTGLSDPFSAQAVYTLEPASLSPAAITLHVSAGVSPAVGAKNRTRRGDESVPETPFRFLAQAFSKFQVVPIQIIVGFLPPVFIRNLKYREYR